LKHKLIYFESRGKVKGIEKPRGKREEEDTKQSRGDVCAAPARKRTINV
jgi:hypothetical protein